MRYSFVLTVAESKMLIGKGLACKSFVKQALINGKILLKGGTTVSAFSESIGGPPLSISGRVTPGGLRASAGDADMSFLWLMRRQGKTMPLSTPEEVIAVSGEMRPGDLAVTGANLIDQNGHAAIMIGSPLGGGKSWVLNLLAAEGVRVVIAAGLEKLCPSVPDAVAVAGRMTMDGSQGMAVGLLPITGGELFTELEAISTLAPVKAYVIGRGGVAGAEGGTTFLVEGEKSALNSLLAVIEQIKGAQTSGAPESLISCEAKGGHCRDHLGCVRSRWKTGGHLWRLSE
jgi:hypothetical protein